MSYQAMKRHGINKCILPSERRQFVKAAYFLIPTIWNSVEAKLWR
jgi:hypothetical protein